MWEEVYTEPTDILERMPIEGGCLYRNRVVVDGSEQSPGGFVWAVSMTWVPDAEPPAMP